jgi:hypothetical protein
MSPFGTELTSRDVYYSPAYEGEVDVPNNPADFRR